MPDSPSLRDRQDALKRAYRTNPDLGMQTTVATSVTGQSADPTKVRIVTGPGNATVFEVTAHSSVGGAHDLPCSGDLFIASLVACQEITIRMVAAALGIELRSLAIRAEGDWDARGTLALDRDVPVAYQAIRLVVDMESDASSEQIERLQKSSARYCVVSASLESPPAIETTWTSPPS